jgi:hypothetical protein
MELCGVREHVCAVQLFIRKGSITQTQRRFHCDVGEEKKKGLSRVKSHSVGHSQLAHLRTLSKC